MAKRPFDIDLVMARIGEAVRTFPKAAMFELADEGFGSPFEQLVACIISIRTRDEMTLVCRAAAVRAGPHARGDEPARRVEDRRG